MADGLAGAWRLVAAVVAALNIAAAAGAQTVVPIDLPRLETQTESPADIPAVKPPTWRGALQDSVRLLAVEHSIRIGFQAKTRRELGGPFFKDYARSVRMPQTWGDGDSPFVNYIGHPIHGAAAGFVWLDHEDGAHDPDLGFSRAYWASRGRATAWAAGYSLQFEFGPLSEASIGNVGLRRGDHRLGRSRRDAGRRARADGRGGRPRSLPCPPDRSVDVESRAAGDRARRPQPQPRSVERSAGPDALVTPNPAAALTASAPTPLHAELDDPPVVGAGDHAERRRADAEARVAQPILIEQVERLDAHLDVLLRAAGRCGARATDRCARTPVRARCPVPRRRSGRRWPPASGARSSACRTTAPPSARRPRSDRRRCPAGS